MNIFPLSNFGPFLMQTSNSGTNVLLLFSYKESFLVNQFDFQIVGDSGVPASGRIVGRLNCRLED